MILKWSSAFELTWCCFSTLLEIDVLVNTRFDSLKWVLRAAEYKENENIERK